MNNQYNLGIVGQTSGSFAPLLYSQFLAQYNINGGYSAFKLEDSAELPVLIHFLERFGFMGLNLTSLHKQSAIQYLHEADEPVRELGVADTLHYTEGWKGYNTDIYGFKRLLELEDIDLSGKNILITGAGAACRAVIYVLKSMGLTSVHVANRNEGRVEDLREKFPSVEIKYLKYQQLKDAAAFDAVINTSAAEWGNKIWRDHFLGDAALLSGHMPETAIDFDYRAAETPFLAQWGSSRKYNGLAVFAEKAVKSFEIFFGITPKYSMDDLKKIIYNGQL